MHKFTSILWLFILNTSWCWSSNTVTLDSLMQVLEVSQEEKNQKTESKILLEIGKVFQGESKYEKALEYLDQATKIAEGINHYEVLHQSLKATALVNLSKGNYEDSYAYQSRLLNLFQSKQDSVKIAKTYYNIGSIFFYQEDFSKALEQYQTAMGIAESLKDSNVLYICNAAIGSVYGEKKDSRLSSAYNLRSLDIAEAMDYKVGIAYSARNLGLSYSAQKEYQKALGNFKRSLEIMHEMGNSSGESINLWSIGTTYSKLKEHKLALNHLEDALKIANKVGDKSHLREMYEDIAEAYFEAGKLVDAYQYQKKYVTLKDSLVNEERVKQMSDLQHQNELQQTELEVLKKDQQLQNMLKIFLGVSAFLLLLISTLLYSRYRLQTKSNGLLADANLAIQEQNKKLAATNSDLEKFAFIASHDLKEPLRMIGGYSSLIERRYSANFSDNAKQFMGYINEAVERMYQLLDDLLAYSKLNIEEKSYEKFSMKKMVADLVQGIQENHPEAEIHVQNLPEKLLANKTEISLVMQNLIHNAIKFKNSEPVKIDIDCQLIGASYTFSIKDNGIGIHEEYLEQIFLPFQRLHTRNRYEGNGIGLAICKKVVEQHKGKIWVESVEGKGSVFHFSLPHIAQKTPKPTQVAFS